MSTSMFASLIGPRIAEAIPGTSLTPNIVNFASSRVNAIPEMIGCSIESSSFVINVPGFSSKLDNTRRGTWYLLANSTALVCRTRLPKLASSNISSNVIRLRQRAPSTTLGSVVKTPSTSVYIWHSSAFSTAARATAVVSEPPRPRVVMLPF